MIENSKGEKTDLPLFKHGVHKLSIYSLYTHLPSAENTKGVGNKLQTGRAGTFRTLEFRKVNFFLRVNRPWLRNTSVQQLKRKSISLPPKH